MNEIPCELCGQPPDPASHQVTFVPKWWAHTACVQKSGMSPDEIDQTRPCCVAMRTLEMFAGCVVQREAFVPSDEIWMADPQTKTINRYRVDPNGVLLLRAEAPEAPEAPVGAS